MHILRCCFLSALIAFKHFAFALFNLLLRPLQDHSSLEHPLLLASEWVGVLCIVFHSQFTCYKDNLNEDETGEGKRRDI